MVGTQGKCFVRAPRRNHNCDARYTTTAAVDDAGALWACGGFDVQDAAFGRVLGAKVKTLQRVAGLGDRAVEHLALSNDSPEACAVGCADGAVLVVGNDHGGNTGLSAAGIAEAKAGRWTENAEFRWR